MKQRISFLLAIILLLATTTSAAAQEYYFSLDQEIVHAYWNSDGTLALDYTFVFTNQPDAHTIDFVDVGLPNADFSFGSISAEVNGSPVTISSDYQGSGSGVAVDLGAYAIQPGQTGRVRVYVGRVESVLYPDDDDPAYASAVFSPTWFGRQYVTGSTDLTVTFHLPPGVQPQEPRYHMPSSNWPGPQQPQAGFDEAGRVTYTWRSSQANGYTQYTFGVSFPASYVPETAIVRAPPFDFSALFDSLFNLACCLFFAFMFFGAPVLSVIANQRRKFKYLPPKISIEGHGIKRGLTAVEAAILMEQPLDKVMTMILFGVIKKGAAEVVTREPLKLRLSEPPPEGLHEYEHNFLSAFRSEDAKQRRNDLEDMFIKLVRSVSEKMKGFSRRETVEYYKSIMERAWQQVEAADTPEVKSQLFDQNLEWTMLDRDYDDRTRRVFTEPVFVPTWWHRYDPTFGRPAVSGPRPVATAAPSVQPRGLPGSDFAASVVRGVQNFSQRVIGDIGGFTTRVTNVTNPPPVTSRSSLGRSGSGGCACACACACAGCACACAGGGR